MADWIEVDGADVVGRRADNPGPFTLEGTNAWIVGRDPAWVVDPGPDIPSHVDALVAEITRRGGLAGIALTHDHSDHSDAVGRLRAAFPDARLAGARGAVDVRLSDGEGIGPLRSLATPGHAPDHLAYLLGDDSGAGGQLAFVGDAVLGRGSVFVAPDPGALAGYLDALERLRARRPRRLLPGHGPIVVDPDAKLAEYLAHRRDRERALVAALEDGARTIEEMLDAAWGDVPGSLRPAAAVTLAAHLDKLADEGRLPGDAQRPELPDLRGVG